MTLAQLINYLIAFLCTIYQGHQPTTTTTAAPAPAVTTTTTTSTSTTDVPETTTTLPPIVSIPGPTFTICVDSAGNATENC